MQKNFIRSCKSIKYMIIERDLSMFRKLLIHTNRWRIFLRISARELNSNLDTENHEFSNMSMFRSTS